MVLISDGHGGDEGPRLRDPALRLSVFRSRLYGCFGRRADGLFELADAILTQGLVLFRLRRQSSFLLLVLANPRSYSAVGNNIHDATRRGRPHSAECVEGEFCEVGRLGFCEVGQPRS